MQSPIPNQRFARLELVAGVNRTHAAAYFFSAMASIMLLTYFPQAQPLLLSELRVPAGEVGKASGDITFAGEIVALLTIGLWGTLSDKIGRRPVYAVGFLLLSIGLIAAPLSTSVLQLTLFRVLFGFGASAVTGMISTVIADYIVDRDRGRAGGLQGVMNGVGALITVFLLLRLPALFRGSGMESAVAARAAYWLVAGLAAISAIVLWLGLKPGRVARSEHEPGFLQLVREGAVAARDPEILLAYLASFVSRGDLAIVGTFFTLWVAGYAQREAGMDGPAALARAGLVVGVAQSAALLGAPLIGILSDRLRRVDAVIIAVAVAGVGYLSTLLVDNPLGPMMFASAVLIGLGEVFGVIASGVLIAEKAPRTARGSVIGFFGLCGAIGILIASKLGGALFDAWRPAAPFVLFGIFGIVAVFFGLWVRARGATVPATAVTPGK